MARSIFAGAPRRKSGRHPIDPERIGIGWRNVGSGARYRGGTGAPTAAPTHSVTSGRSGATARSATHRTTGAGVATRTRGATRSERARAPHTRFEDDVLSFGGDERLGVRPGAGLDTARGSGVATWVHSDLTARAVGVPSYGWATRSIRTDERAVR